MITLLFYLITLSGCGYAMRYGAHPERMGGVIYLAGALATSLLGTRSQWNHFEFNIFMIDLIVLVGFWGIALSSNRFWPYWVTGWQLVGVIIHVQKALLPGITATPYGLLSMLLAYPILGVIILASGAHRHERAPSDLP